MATRSVGICDRCCGPVLLRLEGGRRSASCSCGTSVVSQAMFTAAGYGDPDARPNTPSDRALAAALEGGSGRWWPESWQGPV